MTPSHTHSQAATQEWYRNNCRVLLPQVLRAMKMLISRRHTNNWRPFHNPITTAHNVHLLILNRRHYLNVIVLRDERNQFPPVSPTHLSACSLEIPKIVVYHLCYAYRIVHISQNKMHFAYDYRPENRFHICWHFLFSSSCKKKRETISKRHSFIACTKTLHHFFFTCDFIKLYLTFSICHLSLFHLVEHILRYTLRNSPERWAATRRRDSQIRSKQSKVWRSTVLCCTIFFLYMEVSEKRFALFCRQTCSTRVWEWKWHRRFDIQHLRFAIVQNYSLESSSHFNHILWRAFLSCGCIWTNLLVVCSFAAWSVGTSSTRRK